MITRYNGGGIAPISTNVAPMTGTTYMQPTSAIGDALQQLGQQGSQLAIAYQRTNDARHLIESEQDMQKAQIDFSKWQQSPEGQDESKWLPEWEKRTGDLQKSMDKRPISEQARLGMTRSFSSWSGNQMLNLQGQAVKQAGARARQAASNTIQMSLENGDGATAHAAASLMGSTGNALPEEVDAMHMSIDSKLKDKARTDALNNASAFSTNGDFASAEDAIRAAPFTDSEKNDKLATLGHQKEIAGLITIANDDPRRSIELAYAKENAGKLSGPDRVRIVDTANARLNELRSASVKDYTSRIQMGVADKEKIAGEITDNPNLEPMDKANLAVFLDRGPVNDPVTYAKLYAEAKSFDGKEGSPEYSRLLSRVDMTLKEDQKSSVIAALDASTKGSKSPKAIAGIYQQMGDDLSAGLFGPVHGTLSDLKTKLSPKDRAEVDAIKAELLTPAEQERLKTEPSRIDYIEGKARETWYTRNNPNPASGENFTNHIVEDEDSKRAAADRAWKAMREVESFQQKNPSATPEEIKAHYDSQLVRQRAAVNANPLLPPVEGSKIDLNAILKKYAPNSGK